MLHECDSLASVLGVVVAILLSLFHALKQRTVWMIGNPRIIFPLARCLPFDMHDYVLGCYSFHSHSPVCCRHDNWWIGRISLVSFGPWIPCGLYRGRIGDRPRIYLPKIYYATIYMVVVTVVGQCQ